MSILKSDRPERGGQADTGRRSFMWKVGAGMSAVLAAAVPAVAGSKACGDKNLKERADSLTMQVALLEDEKSIRRLQDKFEYLVDRGMYEDVLDLFTDDAETVFNGGIFKGRNSGVKRMFCDLFSSGMTGRKMEPAPGFQKDSCAGADIINISKDRKSAAARFAYSIQAGAPIDSDSLLVKMARFQGEGIMKWWEAGVYEVSLVKTEKNGAWKIKKLEYNVQARADYKPGRTVSKSIEIPIFTKVYPEDLSGPDRLVV